MSQTLDELYFVWLYRQIGSVNLRNPARTYWSLARQLYTKPFVWFVMNDENRVEDGKDLRHDFVNECHIEYVDHDWMTDECSVLELIIALARRLAFEDDRPVLGWFWRLIDNLELEQFTDRYYNQEAQDEIDEVLDRLIWRTYGPDGHGGLFPLERPMKDQRDIELWYQLASFLYELE